jgi:hypothetical protein
MVEKETVGVRLAPDKVERIEELAEEKQITKSDATRRLIDKGIDFKDSDIGTLLTDSNGSSTESDKEPVADGGTITRDLFSMMAGLYAATTLSLFITIGISAVTSMEIPYDDLFVSVLLAASLLTTIATIPLYTDLPEKVDQLLYSGVDHVPYLNKVVA